MSPTNEAKLALTSPWVRRAIEAQMQRRHASIKPVEPTLGDHIRADRHELRVSCGPFGTRCGQDHGRIKLCPNCREALATWCYCPVARNEQEKAS
jgi:hypothetical protein